MNHAVGIIGLGLLGGAIAARLVERGRQVVGYDRDPQRRQAAAELGVAVVDSALAVAESCDVIMLSLPDGTIAADVLTSLAAQLSSQHTIVDTTTAAPEQMTLQAARARAVGARFIEAEVAGSSAQARRGEVLVFTAGDRADVAAIEEVLGCFAAEFHYVGPTGAAARFKLVHNLMLGLHRAVLAEGLTFAESLGLDAGRTLELLLRSPAASTAMAVKGAKMAARDFAPQATVRQHLKDVRLILAAAAGAGSAVPLSTLHAELLQRAVDLGHSESDNTAVIEAFRR